MAGMLPHVPTPALAGVAAVGGAFVISFGMFVRDRLVRQQAKRGFYQDAVRVARRDKGVQHLMGQGFIDQVRGSFPAAVVAIAAAAAAVVGAAATPAVVSAAAADAASAVIVSSAAVAATVITPTSFLLLSEVQSV